MFITNGITIERKNKDEIHISYNESPKVVISTNFSIAGVDDSTLDRQFIIEFSDFYNKSHRLIDDFGKPSSAVGMMMNGVTLIIL